MFSHVLLMFLMITNTLQSVFQRGGVNWTMLKMECTFRLIVKENVICEN